MRGGEAFDPIWAKKFRWYFGPGQTVFLRSSHGATVRRLEARSMATEADSEDTRRAAEPWRQEIRDAVKAGARRCSLPWAPLITASPSAEKAEVPAVVEAENQTRGWDILSEVSAGLNKLSSVCKEGPTIIESLFDDGAEDWRSQGLWHGPLYRFDPAAIRLVGKLRAAYSEQVKRRREKAARLAKAMKSTAVFQPDDPPSDIELVKADLKAAAQIDDRNRQREYAAIEKTGLNLAILVSGIWNDLHRGDA